MSTANYQMSPMDYMGLQRRTVKGARRRRSLDDIEDIEDIEPRPRQVSLSRLSPFNIDAAKRRVATRI